MFARVLEQEHGAAVEAKTFVGIGGREVKFTLTFADKDDAYLLQELLTRPTSESVEIGKDKA